MFVVLVVAGVLPCCFCHIIKKRPNYHPAVGQLCGSHHVTQLMSHNRPHSPKEKKTNKKTTYFCNWEGTAWGETNGTYNFSKHIVVSYSKIQQMLLKVRERERERERESSVWRYCGLKRCLEDVCFRSPISEAVGQRRTTSKAEEPALWGRWNDQMRKHHTAAIITSPAVKFGIFVLTFSERDDFV